jgi:hypothetical protein
MQLRLLSLDLMTPHTLQSTEMTKQLLISQLRTGKNGNDILHILDVLCNGMDSSESNEDSIPTLDEIQF